MGFFAQVYVCSYYCTKVTCTRACGTFIDSHCSMTHLRTFLDLCLFVYVLLQCIKTTYLLSQAASPVWEGVARISLVGNPILLFLLFLHEPQTVPVLLLLIFMHILLATDWTVTYMRLHDVPVNDTFPMLIRYGYVCYLILRAFTYSVSR